jgi:hypothetical protein
MAGAGNPKQLQPGHRACLRGGHDVGKINAHRACRLWMLLLILSGLTIVHHGGFAETSSDFQQMGSDYDHGETRWEEDQRTCAPLHCAKCCVNWAENFAASANSLPVVARAELIGQPGSERGPFDLFGDETEKPPRN